MSKAMGVGSAGVEALCTARTRYVVDGDDRLSFVDEAWLSFARSNDAPELQRDRVLGRSLWSFIAGEETQQLYRIVLARVRRHDTPVMLPFRCDSGDRRRFMRLLITPGYGGELRFEASTEREETRSAVRLLEVGSARSPAAWTVCCSWCKRLRVSGDEWLEVEDAIVRLGLFVKAPFPRLSHGICPACERHVRIALGD